MLQLQLDNYLQQNPFGSLLSIFQLLFTLASLFTIPFGWVMPSVQDLILLSMIGFLGGFANLWLSSIF